MNQQPSEQEMSFPGVLECFRLKTCAKLFSVWKSMIFKRRPRTKSLHDVLFWNLWFWKPSNLSPHLWPVTTQIVLFVNWEDYWGVSVGQWGNLMEWALFKHPPRHLWLALGLAVGHCWRNSSGQIACMGKRMTSNNICLDMSFCGRQGQQVG